MTLPNIDPNRHGDFIQTFHGGCFWPLEPRPEEVHIEDIAHALSMQCRYAGHCLRFFSVAEHSVLVSRFVKPENALWGLLHDAAEAYSADIPRPLKQQLTEWQPIEARIMQAVCRKFGLSWRQPADVAYVDKAMIADEQAAVMRACERDWGELPPKLGARIECLSPEEAEYAFMVRFWELTE